MSQQNQLHNEVINGSVWTRGDPPGLQALTDKALRFWRFGVGWSRLVAADSGRRLVRVCAESARTAGGAL